MSDIELLGIMPPLVGVPQYLEAVALSQRMPFISSHLNAKVPVSSSSSSSSDSQSHGENESDREEEKKCEQRQQPESNFSIGNI